MRSASVKVYKVTFNRYTNYSCDTISNGSDDIKTSEYLSVGTGNFLIREDEIDYYRQWGRGIKTLELVGYMVGEDND